VKSSQQRS